MELLSEKGLPIVSSPDQPRLCVVSSIFVVRREKGDLDQFEWSFESIILMDRLLNVDV